MARYSPECMNAWNYVKLNDFLKKHFKMNKCMIFKYRFNVPLRHQVIIINKLTDVP